MFSWFPSRAAKTLSDLLLLRMTTLYCRIVLFVLHVWLYSGPLENSVLLLAMAFFNYYFYLILPPDVA